MNNIEFSFKESLVLEDKTKEIKKNVSSSGVFPRILEQLNVLEMQLYASKELSERNVIEITQTFLDVRRMVEEYQQSDPFTVFEEKNFIDLGNVLHTVNHLQSRFVKSLSQTMLKENEAFYEKVAEVWSKTCSHPSDGANFGRRLVQYRKKDPVIVQAINEHFRTKQILAFIELLKKGEGVENTLEAYLLIDPLDRKVIEEHLGALAGTKGPSEDSIKKMIIENPPLLLNCIETFFKSDPFKHTASIPFFHNIVTMDYFQKLQDCTKWKAKSLYQKITDLYQQNMQEEVSGPDFAPKFIKQFMDHPLIIQAMDEILIEELEKLIFIFKNQEEANLEGFFNLPAFVLKEIKQQFNRLPAGLNNQEQFLQASINYKLELENEIKTVINKEKRRFVHGLFYSVSTVLEKTNERDPVLERNLQIAYEALCYTVRKIPFSSNFFNRENTTLNLSHFSKEDLKKIQNKFQDCRKNVVELELQNSKKKCLFRCNLTLAIIRAKLAERYPLENCGAMSRAAYYYIAKQQNLNISMLQFSIKKKDSKANIPGGDHAYAGIKGNSTKNSVACDPWARIIYSFPLIEKLLKDYAGMTSFGTPKLKLYDPKQFFIKLSTPSILSKLVFKDIHKQFQETDLYQYIKTKIDLFYQSKGSEKQEIAADLYKAIRLLLPNTKDPILQSFGAHLQFFLTSKLLLKSEMKNQ